MGKFQPNSYIGDVKGNETMSIRGQEKNPLTKGTLLRFGSYE